MDQSKKLKKIEDAAQLFFDWVKKYHPTIDVSDEKGLSLYTAVHSLKQAIEESKE